MQFLDLKVLGVTDKVCVVKRSHITAVSMSGDRICVDTIGGHSYMEHLYTIGSERTLKENFERTLGAWMGTSA